MGQGSAQFNSHFHGRQILWYFAQMANLRCVTTARATQQVEEDNGVSVTKAKVSSCSSDAIWADGWGEEMIP